MKKCRVCSWVHPPGQGILSGADVRTEIWRSRGSIYIREWLGGSIAARGACAKALHLGGTWHIRARKRKPRCWHRKSLTPTPTRTSLQGWIFPLPPTPPSPTPPREIPPVPHQPPGTEDRGVGLCWAYGNGGRRAFAQRAPGFGSPRTGAAVNPVAGRPGTFSAQKGKAATNACQPRFSKRGRHVLLEPCPI